MEDRNILSSFYANICYYFSGKCSGKCALVKKHKEHLQTEGDFSIVLNLKAQQKHAHINMHNNEHVCQCECTKFSVSADSGEDGNLEPEKVSKNLVKLSDGWSLKLLQCSVHNDRLCLFLNRLHTFKTVLFSVLAQETVYGKLPNNYKKVVLTQDCLKDAELMMNLTDYRRNLVRNVLVNLLTETGHLVNIDVDSEASYCGDWQYHLSSKPTEANHANVLIYCGTVSVNTKNGKGGNAVTTDYLRQRSKELKEMSRQKHGPQVDNDPKWEAFFNKIGEASLKIDLLSIRPSRSFSVNFTNGSQETSRNAHFILYNCARLSAIQEKYEKKCSENIYPSLVPLESVDLSLLTKEEEWDLLTNYLLMYPHVLQSTIEFIDKGKPLPNLLCQFLFSLCGCYSSYYRRVRVLTESRDHLLPVMFARLYLIKAVECVIHNALRLLGIEPNLTSKSSFSNTNFILTKFKLCCQKLMKWKGNNILTYLCYNSK
ncbi:DALR anticodon-binding domain-containing protein [Gryllus bimaculatus]|nr:DALR anticodon-binding domain-containing protein [Gryllus bimaculatus]